MKKHLKESYRLVVFEFEFSSPIHCAQENADVTGVRGTFTKMWCIFTKKVRENMCDNLKCIGFLSW